MGESVIEIVERYLKGNGFDGLYSSLDGCGCKIGDLSAHACINADCEAGVLDLTGCGSECRDEHDYHIVPESRVRTATKEPTDG